MAISKRYAPVALISLIDTQKMGRKTIFPKSAIGIPNAYCVKDAWDNQHFAVSAKYPEFRKVLISMRKSGLFKYNINHCRDAQNLMELTTISEPYKNRDSSL